jgi:hypothetical protein
VQRGEVIDEHPTNTMVPAHSATTKGAATTKRIA